MNRQIARLFAVFVALFVVLIVFTSRSTVFQAGALRDNPKNARATLEQLHVPRGIIYASDGTRLVVNKRTGHGQNAIYSRTYPTGPLFSHAVGYSFVSCGQAGLEKSQNDFLSGNEDEFSSLIDELAGGRKEGDDVHTTLNAAAQRRAIAAMAGQKGSVVALEPSTGAVRVMLSIPEFDPNQVPGRCSQLNRDPNAPLFDRATQARYPPGSSFKVVTAAAALDTGRYTPDSMISGKNNKIISGVPLQNFGGENFGLLSLTDALTHSVNTVFGEVGEKLGKKTMYRYMRRFGFDQEPQLDYPSSQMTPSGVFSHGKLLTQNDSVDIGRVAIGQERLQVTPLQMAMVAAAVANKGVLIKPHLVDKVVKPDGRVRKDVHPRDEATVMSEKAASQLGGMMSKVVEEGTGTAAALSGIDVAGKTGTAEVPGGQNQAWFIAFAPVHNPRIAIAVTVERTSGEGGTVAAPIAKQVMQVLLGGHG